MTDYRHDNSYDNTNHYSDCTGPNCNCDERRYGSRQPKSGDGILLVLAIVLGLICPPIGFILMMIFAFR
ncbi:MAG: hypothetical protein ACI4FW_05670 [Bariatricus sp.]